MFASFFHGYRQERKGGCNLSMIWHGPHQVVASFVPDMDVLEIFRDAPNDIQELLIHAMAKDSRQYLASWSYDGETKAITLHCLHELFCSDSDIEKCLFRPILVSLLSGIPQKVVVNTGYLDRVNYMEDLGWFRLQRGSGRLELAIESDDFEKNWFRAKLPKEFCVEFVPPTS